MAHPQDDLKQLRDRDGQEWDTKWKNANTPWDRRAPHPALLSTLREAGSGSGGVGGGIGVPDVPRSGRALVPGCGTVGPVSDGIVRASDLTRDARAKGYDVHALAQHGLDTLGIDLSPTAVEHATTWLAAQPPTSARATVRCASFFDLARPEGGYDVFYDYTFLCALPPDLRPLWVSTYTRLAAPHAQLITLQFPLMHKPAGPPYGLSEGVYAELLTPAWERVWGRGIARGEGRDGPGAEGGGGGGGSGAGAVPGAGEAIAIWRRRAE